MQRMQENEKMKKEGFRLYSKKTGINKSLFFIRINDDSSVNLEKFDDVKLSESHDLYYHFKSTLAKNVARHEFFI